MSLFSVIIPTYNRRHTLARAIESVLFQSMRDFELIVVDDGSTDGTAELVENYPATFIRLEQNCGVAKARNRGVSESNGEWIAFLDSDDWWNPNKLQLQLDYCRQNHDYEIVQTCETWIRNGRRVNPPQTHLKKEGHIFEESLRRCMITPSSVILRRSLWDKTGGFDESFPACEDYDLWLRITCRQKVGLVDKHLLTRFGGHPDQLSSAIPCLDRFRVDSLLKMLGSGLLNGNQSQAVRRNLRKRALIMAQGSLKRGKREEYEYYISLS
ncbi:MAG: glycosyltransferase family 2 protein [Chitinispirillaceae bacterium]